MTNFKYLKQWIDKNIFVLGKYRVSEIYALRDSYQAINPKAEYIIENEIVEGDIER